MKDFKEIELQIGDRVIFALNQFKTTRLASGKIIKVDIKQAGMIMALVEFLDDNYGNPKFVQKRVAGWNIYKKEC